MTDEFATPRVTIRRYAASRVCDVVVVVRGREMVVRCPSYSDALKWARLECKSYNIPEPIDFPDDGEPDDVRARGKDQPVRWPGTYLGRLDLEPQCER